MHPVNTRARPCRKTDSILLPPPRRATRAHGCRVVRAGRVARLVRAARRRGGESGRGGFSATSWPPPRARASAFQRDRVEPPQEVPSLELELIDVAVLVGDREVEARVLPGAVHPAGVDADDAVLAPAATKRQGGDRAAVKVGTYGDGFVEGFAAHVRGA